MKSLLDISRRGARFPNFLTILLAAFSLFGFQMSADSEELTLSALKFSYDVELEELSGDLKLLFSNYEKRLNSLLQEAQNTGNTKAALAIREEVDNFRTSSSGDLTGYAKLNEAREIFDSAKKNIEEEIGASQARLTKKYLADLDSLRLSLTQKGDLTAAKEVMEAREKTEKQVSEGVANGEPNQLVGEDGGWIIPVGSEKHESERPVPRGRATSEKFNYVESNETMGELHLRFEDSRLRTFGLEVERAELEFWTPNVNIAGTKDLIVVRNQSEKVGELKGASIGAREKVPLKLDRYDFEEGAITLSIECGDNAVIISNMKSNNPPRLIVFPR